MALTASSREPRRGSFRQGSLPLCGGFTLAVDPLCSECWVLFLQKNTMQAHTTHDSPEWNRSPENNEASCSFCWIHLGCCLAVLLFSAQTTTGGEQESCDSRSFCFPVAAVNVAVVCTGVSSSFIQHLLTTATLALLHVRPLLLCRGFN